MCAPVPCEHRCSVPFCSFCPGCPGSEQNVFEAESKGVIDSATGLSAASYVQKHKQKHAEQHGWKRA